MVGKVIFIKTTNEGSAKHRGDQTAKMLQRAGVNAYATHKKSFLWLPQTMKNPIIVFVKYFDVELAMRYKKQGAIVVWDMVDNPDNFFEPIVKQLDNTCIDGIIYINFETLNRISKTFPEGLYHDYLYHNSFSFDDIPIPKQREFSIIYTGDISECKIQKITQIKKIYYKPSLNNDIVKLPIYLSKLAAAPYHTNLRNHPVKPNTKISIAAKCHSNIISNREAGATIELLGEDYPYLCNFNDISVNRMLKFAKKTYLKDEWHYGLSIMKSVVKRTNDKQITKDYIDYFIQLRIRETKCKLQS